MKCLTQAAFLLLIGATASGCVVPHDGWFRGTVSDSSMSATVDTELIDVVRPGQMRFSSVGHPGGVDVSLDLFASPALVPGSFTLAAHPATELVPVRVSFAIRSAADLISETEVTEGTVVISQLPTEDAPTSTGHITGLVPGAQGRADVRADLAFQAELSPSTVRYYTTGQN